MDGQNLGYIEYDAFLRAALDKKKILTEDRLKNAFIFFDKENNGFIAKDKIKQILVGSNIEDQLLSHAFDKKILIKMEKYILRILKI